MGATDANPPMPEFSDDYVLMEVDADYLAKAVKPKQFIHIDQSECIQCEGCVDICPWKCIWMLSPSTIDEAVGTERPGVDPTDNDAVPSARSTRPSPAWRRPAWRTSVMRQKRLLRRRRRRQGTAQAA